MHLVKEFYSKIGLDKTSINQGCKKAIPMELFKSFLTISVIQTPDCFGSDNNWTEHTNDVYRLIIRGGIVAGVEYLDSLQYGKYLDNIYNNYVNPFYLWPILNKKGRNFFLNYFQAEINEIRYGYVEKIKRLKIELKQQETILQQIDQELINLKK
jgi:hypothetical protein